MSLTSFINRSEVREVFRQEFPKPKMGVKKKLLAPPLTDHFGMVGTAFDYLLRFYLHNLNKRKTVENKWIAENGVRELDESGRFENKVLFKKGKLIIRGAEKLNIEYRRTGVMTDELIKHSYYLAQLDFIFRQGYLDDNFGIVSREDVRDLKKLISLIDPKPFEAKDICLLNPCFDLVSLLVGGADADLLIEDMIIEVKTTKVFEFTREMFNQLIGYYILNLCLESYYNGPISWSSVKRLCIYYSRFGYLYEMRVQDIINRNTFPAFLRWFLLYAGEVFHHSRDEEKDVNEFISRLSKYGIKEWEE